ncbi:MAG: tRNA (adenosine(37)-N6)-threonylcarbamoyltransferase complex ATPase subunit type 1 TsaE [Candidatus Levybacteria bacterium RIFCSPLOWO2_12_FULL_39_17]|nr:MAG: tRNA (adenosine(37)-N6)-threonylcarbamoyltransferase complex ATPase subunit type 1 TsaE [Candidatus Levybacteria bacterium RIFCSPLOWO2_12_FULL_39_17]
MEKETEFITKSARETEDLGQKLAHNFRIGNVVILTGELGAGKTTFVQGVAKGFLVKSRVISPTFILLRMHRGKKDKRNITLYHIDLYRLEGKEGIKTLGLEEIFEDVNGIFLIEWGEKHESLKASWDINFKIIGRDSRRITIRNYDYAPGVSS